MVRPHFVSNVWSPCDRSLSSDDGMQSHRNGLEQRFVNLARGNSKWLAQREFPFNRHQVVVEVFDTSRTHCSFSRACASSADYDPMQFVAQR